MAQYVDWIYQNLFWILAIVIQGFIAYHIYFLSRRVSRRDKLRHVETIREQADALLSEIRQGKTSGEVYLVNTKRYFCDYPENREGILSGFSHIKAEIKETRFNGIAFFSSVPEQLYRTPSGSLSLQGKKKDEAFVAYPVGLVPYEWIEYVDLSGDEYGFIPLFFCHFKGRRCWKRDWKRFVPSGYPYNELSYYRKSPTYREHSDPVGMEYSRIVEPIEGLMKKH